MQCCSIHITDASPTGRAKGGLTMIALLLVIGEAVLREVVRRAISWALDKTR